MHVINLHDLCTKSSAETNEEEDKQDTEEEKNEEPGMHALNTVPLLKHLSRDDYCPMK